MTAISVVSSVLERLNYLEGHDRNPNNPNLLDELKDEVGMLRKELEKAKAILKEAHIYRKEDDKLPEAEKQIIWLFYDCEDVMEKYAQEENTDRFKGTKRIRNLFINNKKHAKRDIHNLTTKIQEFSENCKVTPPKLKRTTSAGGRGKKTLANKMYEGGKSDSKMLLTTPKKDVESIEMMPLTGEDEGSPIGLIKMERKVKHALGCHKRDLPIISIWGPRGRKKTTLARKIYEEAKIAGIFKSFAWCDIPINGFKTKRVLLDILAQLCVQREDELKGMDDMELAQTLYKVLQQEKCLIVIDNMLSLEVWRSIRIAFPFRETDSKVLLTTQEKDMAEEAASAERAYEMILLTREESWEMFMKKAELRDDGGMMAIGKEIVEHCAGSPIAVAIISESLKTKNLDEWQRVLNALEDNKGQSFEEKLVKVLAQSYYKLPHNLKTCFLYLGHLPDDQDIRVETLSLLWMAEGIVPLNNEKKDQKVDTTELFLNELAQRKLLEMEEEEEPKFRKIKSCRLPHLIRAVSVSKRKEEEFLGVVGTRDVSRLSSTPRLAIHLNKYDDERCTFDKSKVRSLSLFETHDSQGKSWPPALSDLKDFDWLRILHFDGVNFRARNLPKGFEKLAYLRYLSFFGCDLEKMPASISNLPYIQTLDLRVRGKMTIPNVLSKMKRLMHLYFPVIYVNEVSGKLSLDGLIELEILENFDTRVCTAKDLSMFNKLRVLKAIAGGNINDLKVIVNCMKNNSTGLQLSFLDLRNFYCCTNEEVSFIKSLPSVVALHILHVQGHIHIFPKKLDLSRNFIELSLNGSELKEDPMPILGKLPNLKSLILNNDAFKGKQMECLESNFPKLRSLKLLHLNYLETWDVVKGSMLELSMLTIGNCGMLLMIPPGLKFIKTLKGLKIVSMSRSFKYTIQREYGEKLNDDRALRRPTIVFE